MVSESKNKTALDFIRQWSQPILILIIGYLLSDKMSDIKDQLKVINTLQLVQVQMRVELDGVKRDINRIDVDVKDMKQSNKLVQINGK